jgi:2-polyprenyl-3-methyl-5-hydroxy-6-metoxy-1,4-benzoquinol methylase
MGKKLDRVCPICACSSGDILYTQNFVVPNEFPLASIESGKVTQYIVTCHRCGFVFADVSISQNNYDEYYAKYAKYSCTGSQNAEPANNDFNNYLTNFIESICDSDKSKNIVDIGCGSGKLLIDLKSRGFAGVQGIDISRDTARPLEQFGIKFKIGSITEENANLGELASFDVACLISVLEHVYDVNIALSNISGMLRENAFLIISVPDAAYYHKELTNPLHQINLEHINHFDEISLDNLMKHHGFLRYVSDKYMVSTEKISSTQMIYAYRKFGAAAGGRKYTSTIKASKSISSLITKWEKAQANEELNRLVNTQEEVVIWGVGNYTYSMLADSILKNCNIVAFIDSNPNKQNTSLLGLSVQSPSFLVGFSGTVIISVAYEPQLIIQQMAAMGLTNVTHVL